MKWLTVSVSFFSMKISLFSINWDFLHVCSAFHHSFLAKSISSLYLRMSQWITIVFLKAQSQWGSNHLPTTYNRIYHRPAKTSKTYRRSRSPKKWCGHTQFGRRVVLRPVADQNQSSVANSSREVGDSWWWSEIGQPSVGHQSLIIKNHHVTVSSYAGTSCRPVVNIEDGSTLISQPSVRGGRPLKE